MDFSKFFYMSSSCKKGVLNLNCVGGMSNETAFNLLRGASPTDKPLIMDVESGALMADGPNASFVHIMPFSERFFKVLSDNQFSGWSSYPLEIRGPDGSSMDGYRGLAVTGRCGPIDESKSKTEIRPPRGPRGRPMAMLIGMYFDPGSWDGSDIFLPDSWGHVIVGSTVKSALERAQLSGITFEPLNELELGFA